MAWLWKRSARSFDLARAAEELGVIADLLRTLDATNSRAARDMSAEAPAVAAAVAQLRANMTHEALMKVQEQHLERLKAELESEAQRRGSTTGVGADLVSVADDLGSLAKVLRELDDLHALSSPDATADVTHNVLTMVQESLETLKARLPTLS
jgi:hypothetical protein